MKYVHQCLQLGKITPCPWRFSYTGKPLHLGSHPNLIIRGFSCWPPHPTPTQLIDSRIPVGNGASALTEHYQTSEKPTDVLCLISMTKATELFLYHSGRISSAMGGVQLLCYLSSRWVVIAYWEGEDKALLAQMHWWSQSCAPAGAFSPHQPSFLPSPSKQQWPTYLEASVAPLSHPTSAVTYLTKCL